MKKLFSVKTITAFILVLTMAMLLPVQTAASATVGKYVSELYVAYGKDADAAKKTLSDKGYTPVDGNLILCQFALEYDKLFVLNHNSLFLFAHFIAWGLPIIFLRFPLFLRETKKRGTDFHKPMPFPHKTFTYYENELH